MNFHSFFCQDFNANQNSIPWEFSQSLSLSIRPHQEANQRNTFKQTSHHLTPFPFLSRPLPSGLTTKQRTRQLETDMTTFSRRKRTKTKKKEKRDRERVIAQGFRENAIGKRMWKQGISVEPQLLPREQQCINIRVQPAPRREESRRKEAMSLEEGNAHLLGFTDS